MIFLFGITAMVARIGFPPGHLSGVPSSDTQKGGNQLTMWNTHGLNGSFHEEAALRSSSRSTEAGAGAGSAITIQDKRVEWTDLDVKNKDVPHDFDLYRHCST